MSGFSPREPGLLHQAPGLFDPPFRVWLVKRVIARCLEDKLLLLNCGTYNQVVRWIPPLIVTQDQIETALGIFERAVAALA